MEWPRSKRYRTLNDISETEYNSLLERVNHCPYRETYHIQPKTGLLNDPNGFSFFQGGDLAFPFIFFLPFFFQA